MGLNVEDLVKGLVYYLTEGNNINDRIVRFNKCKETSEGKVLEYLSRIAVTGNDMESFHRYDIISNKTLLKNIREATQDEIDWLEACEKAGKFVDKPVKKEFIVGKWYKHSNEYYIKYKETILSNDKTYNKVYGEIIRYKEYIGVDYFANREYEAKLLNSKPLEDLSEIQQYLPKDHPDLIKSTKFKKDEYYYVEDNLNYSWLIKFIECDQNNIIAPSISIITNSFYTRSNWGELSSIKSSRLATSKEKAWLEECIKLNKFVPKDQVKSEYLKVEKLVEGCWYIVKTATPFEALFKFKKIKNGNTLLYEGDYYNYTDSLKCYNNPNGLVSIDAIKELKPASNEEVLKYFPNEKFDDNSLKVGDWAIGLSGTILGSIYYNNGVKAFKILSIDYNNSRFTYQHMNKEGKSWESSDYNLNLIRKATDSEIPSTITRVNSQGITKAKSILDDLEDWEETEIKVEVKTWVIEEPKKTKKTRLQLYEEVIPIKVEEVVKLTVKSKINKNK